VLDRLSFDAPCKIGGDGRCHILIILEGLLFVEGDPALAPMSRGSTALVPACLGPVVLTPQNRVTALDAFLPE
jgi:hypothetical protein